jgi:hypothetical protein
MADLNERFALLIQVKAIPFVASIGISTPSRRGKFSAEVGSRDRVILRISDVDIVQPELRLVIASGLLRLVSICNINIRISIVVEVKRAAAPGPT